MTILELGATVRNALRQQLSGKTVSITRNIGGTPFVTNDVPATPGKSDDIAEDQFGGMIRENAADFLILATDYVIQGAATEPKRGDIITWNGNTFKVLPDGQLSEWDWHDPNSRTTYRVRTKED